MANAQIQSINPRLRNAAATRAAILEAAKARFIEESYDRVGVRQIAGDAGVDAALISRYFGSKEELFAEVLTRTTSDPMEIIAGPRHEFGRRMARAFFDPTHKSQQEGFDFINLAARSTMSPVAGEKMRQHIEQHFVRPFAAWLGDVDAMDKAWLTASVLMGVALMRSIVCGPGASPSEKSDSIAQLANTLQAIVDAGSAG